ncbi:N-acetylmuramidase domain-containing protein [Luteitalea sp.]|uniref:N-acetylmuramidase domain-containing protein n=1 Tax=Luteitalea sp. TaxID=2004800 RepID=UPI0037CBDF4B
MTSITDQTWIALAETLHVEKAVLQAVAQVESGGSGFLATDPPRPKVLFEGHYFHRLTSGRFAAAHPTISFPTWTRKHYAKTGLGEWARLEQAIALDRASALQSASWGAFQIMGANFAQAGCADVEAFVTAQWSGVEAQLECFTRFIDRAWYLDPLRAKDWATFARRYNGPGYAANAYDVKLARAYDAWVAAAAPTARGRRGLGGLRRRGEETRPPGRPLVAAVPLEARASSQRLVRADALDLRDWPYRPRIGQAPPAALWPARLRPVAHQGRSSACTGFALATIVEYLLDRAGRPVEAISGHMLYDMARRYDEWADNDTQDQGSSLRGALRGWYYHGASAASLWRGQVMPGASLDEGDWWLDAVKRPLGAYFRVQADMVPDMHSALAEAGVLYASALTHAGWDALHRATPTAVPATPDALPVIEAREGLPDAGHAFAIVGYTERGFLVHNSWGDHWGAGGFAILTYADWRQNAMDCWVAQLGVVTDEHRVVAEAPTLRVDAASGRVQLSSNRQLAAHEISPFVLTVDAEGRFCTRGRFRTNADDVALLIDEHLPRACERWGCADTVDIAIVAHDGLTGEDGAVGRALHWIPQLYSAGILPVFLLWETDAAGGVRKLLEAKVATDDVPARPMPWRAVSPSALLAWHDERIEGRLRQPGRALWREVRDHATAIATGADAAFLTLADRLQARARRRSLPTPRVHLVAHSAGALVATHAVPELVRRRLPLRTLSLIAPAVGVETFTAVAGAALEACEARLLVAHLTDAAERSDATCAPYGRSLLWLVSRVLEDEPGTPLVGLEAHLARAVLERAWGRRTTRLASPGGTVSEERRGTVATTHGSLPEDPAVLQAIITHIKQS